MFQVLDQDHTRWGKDLYVAAGQTLVKGQIAYYTSGSTLAPTSGLESCIAGIVFGDRHAVYLPTTQTFQPGEALTIVQGKGHALLSADLFTSGSLPSILCATLYAGTGGKWAENGTFCVGRFLRREKYWAATAGIGVPTEVAHVEFDLGPCLWKHIDED